MANLADPSLPKLKPLQTLRISSDFMDYLLRADLIALLELVETNAQYEEDENRTYWLAIAERLSIELNQSHF